MNELNVNNLRKQIGYVGQLPTLFNGTVRQNILLGKQDATEEEIQAAAKNAQAHDFIMNLPDGYDTEVGPGGNLLSGGQKQRVAIARAIGEFFTTLVLIIACIYTSASFLLQQVQLYFKHHLFCSPNTYILHFLSLSQFETLKFLCLTRQQQHWTMKVKKWSSKHWTKFMPPIPEPL